MGNALSNINFNNFNPWIAGAIVALVVTAAHFFFKRTGSPRPKRIINGPFLEVPRIKLEHEHPLGWGSTAVINTIKAEPKQDTLTKIVAALQTQGCAVIDNLYEDLPVEKLTYEVNDVMAAELKEHEAEIAQNVKTLTAKPGPFIKAVIHSLSTTFMNELNIAFEKWHQEGHPKTAYSHDPMEFAPFAGFNAQQLRLRLPGVGLDTHVDRASAKLTLLYYLNECQGGEIVLYLLPEDKRNFENRLIFEKDGGLSQLQDLLQPLKIQPKMNTLVVFWSDCTPHEVLDIESNRLSFQVFISKKAEE